MAADADGKAAPSSHATGMESVDLSIVMPCLNEAETLEACIESARRGIERTKRSGEIVIADNGSTDGSLEIATRLGACVVNVAEKGYGNALRGGIASARGRWIIMGDADSSYDFSAIDDFVTRLREGCDLVMGCRLPSGGGTIKPSAMPWKNRWLGNPVLSTLGRLFFKTPIHDFHCGLRGFSKRAYESLDLQTTGMEFASEMVMKATLKGMNVAEVPITLHPDGRSRPPHLRAWRDGWRHLRFMLIYSPRWLFLAPGLFLILLGTIGALLLWLAPREIFGIGFDVGTQLVASMSIIAGIQIIGFACFTKVFGIGEGLLPEDEGFSRVFRFLTLERGVTIGLAVLMVGALLFGNAVWNWKIAGFHGLDYAENLRLIVPAVTAMVVGLQIVFSSFFMSVLGLKTTHRHPFESA